MLVASRAATQWILCCSAVSQLRGFTCAAPRLRVMAQPLPMLMREIRNKSRRLRRLQAQTAAFGDASSPGPRLSARAMHVYTLTGCSNAAACYLAWAADTCSASLAELTLVVDSLLAQPRGSRTNARDVLAAAGFVLQRRLWEWIHNQNVQRGVAPSRAMLVERARQLIPDGVPPHVAARLLRPLRLGRSQRRYLASFRKHFACKLGKLRVMPPMTQEERRAKVSWQVHRFVLPYVGVLLDFDFGKGLDADCPAPSNSK